MLGPLLALLLAQAPAFDSSTLEAADRVDGVTAPDLDGDGRADLVIQNGRDLQIFLNRKGLATKPDQVLRLRPGVFLWTLAALGKGQTPHLLTAGVRAIRAHAFQGGGFDPAGTDLVVHPSLFENVAPGGPPLRVLFAPDLDGDGAAELLLFQTDRVFVMKRHGPSAYRCLQKLPIPSDVVTSLRRNPEPKVTEVVSVPLLAIGDQNGDGRTDLAYYADERMGVFRQSPDGRFADAAGFDLVVKKRKRRNKFLKFEIPPKVLDFNGDGILDLSLVYPSKGRVQIYYGSAGRTDFTIPDTLIQVSDGWATGVYLPDLDGDGRPELVMGVIRKFGISDGLQVLLSGKVTLELHFYPMQADARYAKDPVQELRFSIPFAFHVTRESATVDLTFRPSFDGDFNGDGRRDLLTAADARTLEYRPGIPGQLIAEEPAGTIAIHPPAGVSHTEAFSADFNGDGVSDLVLTHILPNPPRHVVELLLSR